jgi:hypothetical protein
VGSKRRLSGDRDILKWGPKKHPWRNTKLKKREEPKIMKNKLKGRGSGYIYIYIYSLQCVLAVY